MHPEATPVSLSLLLALLLALSVPTGRAAAQPDTPRAPEARRPFTTEPRWGFQLGRYQNDFALGLNLTSPPFAGDRMAIRVRGSVAFHEHLSVGAEPRTETWTPYANLSAGLVGFAGRVGKSIRLYGEGGAIGLVPPDDLSSATLEVGGYGLFGFSFFAAQNQSYFLEIGGVGIRARADQLRASPIYANGLTISVGFRSGV